MWHSKIVCVSVCALVQSLTRTLIHATLHSWKLPYSSTAPTPIDIIPAQLLWQLPVKDPATKSVRWPLISFSPFFSFFHSQEGRREHSKSHLPTVTLYSAIASAPKICSPTFVTVVYSGIAPSSSTPSPTFVTNTKIWYSHNPIPTLVTIIMYSSIVPFLLTSL